MALEDIITRIENDAEKLVKEQSEGTNSYINEMILEARIRANEESDNIIKEAQADSKEMLSTGKKLALSECKKMILSKKIEYIDELIDKAKREILKEDKKYFRILLNLCNKYAEKGEGIVYLSKSDINRLPKDFETNINSKLSDGKSLKVSHDAIDISNGFIIKYDNFEQNCILDSIFEENREEIIDRLNELLFDER